MLITIAVLSFIGCLFSFINHRLKGDTDIDLVHSTVLVLSLWNINFTLAMVTIAVVIIIGFLSIFND